MLSENGVVAVAQLPHQARRTLDVTEEKRDGPRWQPMHVPMIMRDVRPAFKRIVALSARRT
jgi:hypothetical protein